jgi:hypothetical protein
MSVFLLYVHFGNREYNAFFNHNRQRHKSVTSPAVLIMFPERLMCYSYVTDRGLFSMKANSAVPLCKQNQSLYIEGVH